MFYNNQALITEWVNNLSAFFPVTAPHAKTVIKFWHLLVANQKECFGGKKYMEQKMKCPHCGRCLGVCTITNVNESSCTITAKPPKQQSNKEHIFHSTCQRCKNEIYVVMKFLN